MYDCEVMKAEGRPWRLRIRMHFPLFQPRSRHLELFRTYSTILQHFNPYRKTWT